MQNMERLVPKLHCPPPCTTIAVRTGNAVFAEVVCRTGGGSIRDPLQANGLQSFVDDEETSMSLAVYASMGQKDESGEQYSSLR